MRLLGIFKFWLHFISRSMRHLAFFVLLFNFLLVVSIITPIPYWWNLVYWWILIKIDHPRIYKELYVIDGRHPVLNFIRFFVVCEPLRRVTANIHDLRYNRPAKVNVMGTVYARLRAYSITALSGLPFVYFRFFNTLLLAYIESNPTTLSEHFEFLHSAAMSL